MIRFDDKFKKACGAFDAANSDDPNSESIDGILVPRELAHSRRLHAQVLKLHPDASEELLLASRCQHLRRWEIPRSSYPDGREGYLKWRTDLAKFHAEEASKILREVGYSEQVIERVTAINRKRKLSSDHEVQIMEDALCLVFMEHQLPEFMLKHDEQKVVDIIRKTWKKMSIRGQNAIRDIKFSPVAKYLLDRALNSD